MLLLAVWLLAGLASDFFVHCNANQIEDCNSGRVDLEENTTASLTCSGYTGTVSWQYRIQHSSNVNIGSCSSTCQLDTSVPQGYFTLTHVSDSSSRLGLAESVALKQYIGLMFFCGSARCEMAIVVKAELGALTVNVTTPDTDNGWRVRYSVEISRVFSSQGQYSCVWSRRHEGAQYAEIYSRTQFPEPNPDHDDRSGSCAFTDNLPDTTGNYTYRVQVYPGATVKTDTVVIVSPPVPTITCSPSSGYVSEDADLNCACSGSVGRPEGRLVWIRHDNNNVDIAVKTGSYGQDSLQLTLTVNRTHDGNTLRCDVDWVTDTEGPVHTIYVAYAASNMSFGIDSNKNLTINESERVTFDCQSRGRPTPELQLIQGNSVLLRVEGGKLSLSETTTQLNHTISALCSSTGVYTCSAHNGVGESLQDTAQLYVTCPLMLEKNASEINDYLNYIGKPVSIRFPLSGFPPPGSIDLQYFRFGNSTPTPARDHLYTVECRPKDNVHQYLHTCDLIIDSATDNDRGLYSIVLANGQGAFSWRFYLDINRKHAGTTEASSDYAELQSADIGLRSVYSQLSPSDASTRAVPEGNQEIPEPVTATDSPYANMEADSGTAENNGVTD